MDSVRELTDTERDVPFLALQYARYENTKACHARMFEEFTKEFEARPYLVKHKAYKDHAIYGEKPFHFLWDVLVQEVPKDFRFLEIGVYKGQVLSLIGLLTEVHHKRSYVVGVSPFNGAGDKYSNYSRAVNYKELTEEAWSHSCLGPLYTIPKTLHLITGYSTDQDVIDQVTHTEPYDIIYIDGSHDYEVVVQDIQNYAPLVKFGGFLVMDDAATDRETDNWPGHPDVGRAVNEWLDTDKRFGFVFALGHIKLYRRVS